MIVSATPQLLGRSSCTDQPFVEGLSFTGRSRRCGSRGLPHLVSLIMFAHACAWSSDRPLSPGVRGVVSPTLRPARNTSPRALAERLHLSSLRAGWALDRNDRQECAECRRQTSVTAGTISHRSHLPLPDVVPCLPYIVPLLERHLRPSVQTNGHRQLLDRLAPAPEASARHGRSRTQPRCKPSS
jgi:hypothetical protein